MTNSYLDAGDGYKWYIIEKTKEVDDRYNGLSRDDEYETIGTEKGVGAFGVVPMTDKEKAYVESLGHVSNVYEGGYLSVVPEPDGAEDLVKIQGRQALSLHQAPKLWQKGIKGKGVKVAVLDTGISSSQEDKFFKGRISGKKSFISGETVEDSRSGHGTFCCGQVAASGGDYGVAPESSLLVGKVLGDSGSGSFSAIINGINWAVESGANVISMSLGGPGDKNSPVVSAVNNAFKNNVLSIAAAGNDQRGSRRYNADYQVPSCADDVVCVGAVDVNFDIADFSNIGNSLDIAAIGVQVRGLGLNGVTDVYMSGTSMATPHVAGVATLLFQESSSAYKVRQTLYSGALDTDLASYKEGHGVLKAFNSYRRLKGC